MAYLSIQMDGTDQLPFGIPSFAEIFKKEGHSRIKFHELVAVIDHGPQREVIVYDSMEHLPHNPNLIIDALQRTLKHVERGSDGVLPDTLLLQFDNCFRENKNAYISSYLANLVERGVFKEIRMSFLPVGHTHDICDQVNSRLAVACKRQDIPTREKLLELMRGSYTPTPTVVKHDTIADWKMLVNPGQDEHFTGNSLVFEHSGMSEPHYFSFVQDANGRAGVRTKMTIDDREWSTIFYPFRNHPSGIVLADMPGNDAYAIGDARLEEIQDHVKSVQWRAIMDDDAMESFRRCFAIIKDPPMDWEWADEGKFVKENQAEYPEVLDDHRLRRELDMEDSAPVRQTHLFISHYQRRRYTQQRLEVGDFVAVDVRERHQSEDDILRFYVGVVQSLDINTRTCQLRWWNSSSGEFGKYKIYNGAGERTATIAFRNLLCRFEKLTSLKELYKRDIQAIEAQLAISPNERVPMIVNDE